MQQQCDQTMQQQGAQRTIPHPIERGKTVTLNGTVQSIDPDKGRVTMKGADGETAVLCLGQNVSAAAGPSSGGNSAATGASPSGGGASGNTEGGQQRGVRGSGTGTKQQ